jgi:folate-dependent phosphoribosylglycinamide formyltransferase PurN
MKINGTSIHELAVESVATRYGIAAVTVRWWYDKGDAVMQAEVMLAEMDWREKAHA